jgi:hypothetical protein
MLFQKIERGPQFVIAPQNVLAVFQIEFTGGGDFEWAPGAIEQGDLQLALQLRDCLAGGRLAEMVQASSLADAALVSNVAYQTKMRCGHRTMLRIA